MIKIKLSDITKEQVDVIVNAANTRLKGGGGVDGAIHKAAGCELIDECGKIGHCSIGSAVITSPGNINVKKIIHTVGPVWRGGDNNEDELLKNAYTNSFLLAKKNNLKTIAFPAISTGVYGYPVDQAAQIALKCGKQFESDFDEIRYICFSQIDFDIYRMIASKMNIRWKQA